MDLTFPLKLELAQTPTPMQKLERLSAYIGGPQLWIKRDDMTEFGSGGNKIRKLEFVLARALQQNANFLITCGGVQSNHCRATALLAAKLGLQCHLILRGQQPQRFKANTLVDKLAGANISFHSDAEFRDPQSLFDHFTRLYENRGFTTYSIPMGASDETGLWGYLDCARELLEDIDNFQLKKLLVCCATGSGGTHAGLSLGMHLLGGPPVKAYAVCDNTAYFVEKARQDINAWHKTYARELEPVMPLIDVCDEFIGQGYARTYPELLETIMLVARQEGILLDPVYTGKAFHGMLEQLKRGEFDHLDHLVFLHTGGVFGLFPYEQEFDNLASVN